MPNQARRPHPTAAWVLQEPLATSLSTDQLLQRFRQLFSARLLARWFKDPAAGNFYDRAFTPLITLWYFLFRQVQCDHTLGRVLTDAFNGGADARQRLPLGVL